MADSSLVVKIGGSTLGAHDTSLEDLVELQRRGAHVVVVHGGGPAISGWLARLDAPTRFVRGLRVTDAPALEVVTAVLAGLINKQLVAQLLVRGARAVGLSGADGGLLAAVLEDEELGFVGRLTGVDTRVLQTLLSGGFLPLVAPLALLSQAGEAGTGQLLNVNGDTVAGELAAALKAERLVFLTDVDGVRDAEGKPLRRIERAEAKALLASGVVTGGMIPKVEAALRAGDHGAAVSIVDGRQPHGLLAALEADPPGTAILGPHTGRGERA